MNCLFKAFCALFALLVLWLFVSAALRGSPKNAEMARREVADYHARYNKLQFREIHRTLDPSARWPDEKEYARVMLANRSKWGAFISSSEVGARFFVGTNGRFITLQYESRYFGGNVDETFVFRMSNDRALLNSYTILKDMFH
jgi:hypothetical protein